MSTRCLLTVVALALFFELGQACHENTLAAAPPSNSADLTTPRAALRSFLLAVERGDVAGAKAVSLYEAKHEPWIAAYVNVISAGLKLCSTAEKKFPGELSRFEEQFRKSKKIPSFEEQVTGENANLALGTDTFQLQRIQSTWKIDFPNKIPTVDPGEIRSMRRRALLWSDLTDRISSGDVKNKVMLQYELTDIESLLKPPDPNGYVRHPESKYDKFEDETAPIGILTSGLGFGYRFKGTERKEVPKDFFLASARKPFKRIIFLLDDEDRIEPERNSGNSHRITAADLMKIAEAAKVEFVLLNDDGGRSEDKFDRVDLHTVRGLLIDAGLYTKPSPARPR